MPRARTILTALLALSLAPRLPAQSTPAAPPAIPREFRGVWVASVANIDWPSKPGLTAWQQQAELLAILDRARSLRLNAVLLQVRPAGDALYASKLEPWSAYLTGVEGRAPEPYYDPLAFAVKEAHARGLELHAWFNPYRAKHPSSTGPNARTHLATTHPDWVKRYGGYLWMDPGEPGVLEHSLRVVLDVVKRYDVDGVHVDDYFYPYPEVDAKKVEVPFPDSGSYARYTAKGGTLGLSDWRRHNVDRFVEQLYVRTKREKPWVKVGISPFGLWRPGYPAGAQGFDAYEKLAGDARKWLHEGWVDYFTPQLYWPSSRPGLGYANMLDWWLAENLRKRHMWPGHNASRAAGGGAEWPADELNRQVRATRATAARDTTGGALPGATGDILFSMKPLMATPRLATTATAAPAIVVHSPTADSLTSELYAADALIPASPWLGRSAPARPVARRTRDVATNEERLEITPGARTRWITVRALRQGTWTHWVLPSGYTSLVIGTAVAPDAEQVLVTAVSRNGIEGTVVRVAAPRAARAGAR